MKRTLKSVTIAFEKEADKHVYKKGMGVGTTIANKHSYSFHQRFVEENAKVLKEQAEEWTRIKQNKRQRWLDRFKK